MINRLLHDVVKDDAVIAEKLSRSDLLPLVRELNHRYGMVVYDERKFNNQLSENFLLTDTQGMALGRVFIVDGAYCYNSKYIRKERGADDFDRETVRSKKLSTLMASLKRLDIVSSSDEVLVRYKNNIDGLVNLVVGSFPYLRKDALDGSDAHILLSAMKDGKSLDDFVQSARDKYLEILDKYKEADILKSNRKQGVEEMFSNTYLVLGDVIGHYIIAEATYEYDRNASLVIKPTTPFKRVKDLTAYPRVLSALTMHKVHMGENFRSYNNTNESLMPMGDRYIPELEMVYGYNSRSTIYDVGLLCLAK
jgi:hypothetical protein